MERAGFRVQNASYRRGLFAHCDPTRSAAGEAMQAVHIVVWMRWSAGHVPLPVKPRASLKVITGFISIGRGGGTTVLVNKDPAPG